MAAVPDDFKLQWHPTRGFLQDVAEGEWVDLAATGIRELDCWHGYSRVGERVETGELVAIIDNRDRNLDPTNRESTWWPNLGPRRHLRLRALAGGVWRTVWRGFITKTDPRWSIRDAWLHLEARDALMVGTTEISASVFSERVRVAAPALWLPLDDGGNLTHRGDGGSVPASAVGTTRSDPIMPFTSTSSTSFPYSTSKADFATPGSYQINPLGFTVCAIFHSRSDDGQVILAAGPQPPAAACPSGDIALVADAGGTYSLRVGNASGSTLLQFPQPHNEVGTLVLGWYTGAVIGLEASIGTQTVGGLEVPVNTHFAPRAGVVRVGSGLNDANPFLGSLNHVAVWNRALSEQERRNIQMGYFGRVGDYTNGFYTPSGAPRSPTYAHQALGWALDRLGVVSSRRDIDTSGLVQLGGVETDVEAITLMSRVAACEGGFFFADREGNFVFRLRGAKGSYLGTFDTDPPAGSSNVPLADAQLADDDQTFFTVSRLRVTVADKNGFEAEYRHPNAEVLGKVLYAPETSLRRVEDAQLLGGLAVGSATPTIHIENAEVLFGAEGVDAATLLDSDVLDEATIISRPPDAVADANFMTWGSGAFWGGPGWGGPPPHVQRSTILRVGHTYTRDHSWRTRWLLVPS